MQPVTTYYLEMSDPSSLKTITEARGLVVTECQLKQYPLNKFLYQFIGGPWRWTDKLAWSEQAWKDYVESANLRTWVASFQGAIAGYFELFKRDCDVEILYFGLAEPFIGKGFGGFLLSKAIKSAWEWPGTKRVWVHTCTLDHPNALQNYLARGMTIYKEETENQP